ncbi:extracellular solute-binding protein [Rhodobacteraceae bacterium 2CG4]|uniref:Extracellular solute-binding protein n=1 Tax=Halovulum marinum TaxID=2662447 RepID=A0A6L5YVV3_9RHOB|nr:extracellular solute-binding protein [Halovulum marinum]MSU88473.1 extracellular solute-binding protein [Halovulum marinum]
MLLKNAARQRNLKGIACALLTSSALVLPAPVAAQANKTGIDPETWTPEHVRSIAGKTTVDTAAECSKIVPLDYEGELDYWYVGPNEASPQLEHEMYEEFWAALAETYPNIEINAQNLGYNDMLNKLRTAALGNAAPDVARLPILWGSEFAAKRQLSELSPEDVGYDSDDFWPGAMKSVTLDGKTWGIPTNNETMAFIWNAGIFEEAGLDPDKAPDTWEEVVAYSKQIKEKTGKNGYGLVARVNAGNTPFRFMPMVWGEGGGALDEAADSPTYQETWIDSDGTRRAVQNYYDMYVRDKSVPVSALTNTQTENQDPFLANQLAMVIAHPSEYATMLDRASRATGSDKEAAMEVVNNMRYGKIPKGADRRAVVFGGSNVHIFNPDNIDGDLDMEAAKALICFMTGPEWSTKLAWVSSNPGNTRGFETEWMKERLDTIKFLDVSTSMLPSGIPFPPVAESPEIMNIIIPEMLQNALTEKMTVEEATADAERKIQSLLDGM